VARGFRRAIDRATDFMATTSKEERDEWVSKFTGMKLDVVKEVTLPQSRLSSTSRVSKPILTSPYGTRWPSRSTSTS